MRTALVAALGLVLAGCGQMVWVKPGASNQDFYMDRGQCQAQAFGVPGASNLQIALVYNSCMQGKGWYQERQST